MPLSAEKLQTINAIGLTSARRTDGLAAYPPFPYTILRNATLTMARALAEEGKVPRLLATLSEYEKHGHIIHPKSAAFLLVMVDVYEGASAKPMLSRRDADDDDAQDNTQGDEEDPTLQLARMLGESPSELRPRDTDDSKQDDDGSKQDESDTNQG